MGKRPDQFYVPFGKFKGKTIGEVAKEESGLNYLQWMKGVIEGDTNPAYAEKNKALLWAFNAFFDRDDIKAKLAGESANRKPVEATKTQTTSSDTKTQEKRATGASNGNDSHQAQKALDDAFDDVPF